MGRWMADRLEVRDADDVIAIDAEYVGMVEADVTLTIEDNRLRSARALAARQGKEEHKVLEEAPRRHLGLDILERVSRRSDLEPTFRSQLDGFRRFP